MHFHGLVVIEGKWGAPGLRFESQVLQQFLPCGCVRPGEWEAGDLGPLVPTAR
jgi:hypothetical protein